MKRSLKSVSFCVSAGYYSGYKKNHEMSIALGAITVISLPWLVKSLLASLESQEILLAFCWSDECEIVPPQQLRTCMKIYANTAQDWSPCSEKPETSF